MRINVKGVVMQIKGVLILEKDSKGVRSRNKGVIMQTEGIYMYTVYVAILRYVNSACTLNLCYNVSWPSCFLVLLDVES